MQFNIRSSRKNFSRQGDSDHQTFTFLLEGQHNNVTININLHANSRQWLTPSIRSFAVGAIMKIIAFINS
ncbi:hypothetical protein [Pseudomonas defluvii]|uniref:hypothetical protein n=1 Tax=Pseudomonas defluvii TaxID=1876757 RepID=UPI0039060DE9